MKKGLIILLLIAAPVVSLLAESADYFTFTVGTGGGYDMVGSAITAGIVFGVDYNFDKEFTGGFKFFKLGAGDVTVINISMHPSEALSVSLYSGVDDASLLTFGAGVGYDFFSKKGGLFSSMGVFADWLAGDGGSFDVASGGTFVFGLRSKFGV
jgi:hypothetical protein